MLPKSEIIIWVLPNPFINLCCRLMNWWFDPWKTSFQSSNSNTPWAFVSEILPNRWVMFPSPKGTLREVVGVTLQPQMVNSDWNASQKKTYQKHISQVVCLDFTSNFVDRYARFFQVVTHDGLKLISNFMKKKLRWSDCMSWNIWMAKLKESLPGNSAGDLFGMVTWPF